MSKKKKKYSEDSIDTLETPKDIVQKKSTNFIPTTDEVGAMHIIHEIIDNSLDDIIADFNDTKKGTTVEFTYDEGNKNIIISDDARGIPLKKLFQTCTTLYTSGKFENTDDTTAYSTSGGINGVGLKLVTYLSEYFEIISRVDGKYKKLEFKNGDFIKETDGNTKERGTTIKFKLSQKFIDINNVKTDNIIERFIEKTYLNPKIKMKLQVLNNGKKVSDKTYFGKTIFDKMKEDAPDTTILNIETTKTVTILDKHNDDKPTDKKVEMQIAFALNDDAIDNDHPILAYGNGIKNYIGGEHVNGLKDGMVKYFRNNVFNKVTKKDDIQIIPSDITSGLCGIINIKLLKPLFRGQYKDELRNVEAKIAIRDAVYETLMNEKPSVIKEYSEFIKNIAKGRMASKKIRKKDVTNVFSKDKITSYHAILRSVKTVDPELLILEGKSAISSASVGADIHNQAMYSVFGRPENLIDATLDTVAKAVSVFNNIMDICGIDLHNPVVRDATMNRILLLSDSDVDGGIIAASVIALIAKHCPQLIHANMVGRIIPPAYSFIENKKKKYVESQKELLKYIINKFSKSYKVEKDGILLTSKDLRRLLDVNFDYAPKMKDFSNSFYVDPVFMEYVLLNYNRIGSGEKTISQWKKILKSFKDLTVELDDGNLSIKGSIKESMVDIVFDSYFKKKASRVLERMRKNLTITKYTLNGKPATLYEIMEEVEGYKPKHITRYKGIGEFNPKELGELCIDPKNRIVKMFKFDDIDLDMNKIMVMISNKSTYLEARAAILLNTIADDIEIDT